MVEIQCSESLSNRVFSEAVDSLSLRQKWQGGFTHETLNRRLAALRGAESGNAGAGSILVWK